jgi:hypothetical protein
MKANQAGHGNVEKPKPEEYRIPPVPCIVCGKITQGYGWVDGGKGKVCSRKCDNEYKEKYYARKPGE